MAKLHAYLSYDDAPAALDWLQGIGFEVVARQDGENGSVTHSEVKLGDVVLMVASNDAEYEIAPLRGVSTGSGLYLLVEDVPAIHQLALGAGAREVFPPEQTEWGTWRSRVLDPQGREWSFGTYEPGGSW